LVTDIKTDLRGQFLQGMSCAANTVNVVTTNGQAGRAGVTVSAMASVSADGDAPTMLVCVHHQSAAAQTIIDNGCFCTNILRDDQSYISDVFAGRFQTDDGDKFSCVDWEPMATGALRVKDPLTAFDCKIKSSERVGTHYVFIGEVQEIFVAEGGNPLIFANRTYGSPVTISPPRKQRSQPETLKIGALHTFGPYLLPGIIRKLEDQVGPIDLDLHEGDQRHLMELLRAGTIDLAFVYDRGLGPDVSALAVSELPPYVLLAENDPLARQTTVSLADLLDKPMVLLSASPSRDYFLSLFQGVGEPNVAYRANTFEMVRGMVAHGLGYSLLVTKPASAMSYDGKALVMRPVDDKVQTARLVLSQRRDAKLNKATEAFVWHCMDIFGLGLD
jgi:flavin reductase (DIM6/NTAB) family NADH-FMN oxidoreductase RutF/DNA-binding transcriptional LysR family regulator